MDTQLDTQGLALLIGVFIPLLVSLVTKKTANSTLKLAVNIVLSAVGTAVAVFATSGHHTVWEAVNTFIAALVASLATYEGGWKRVNLNDKMAPNQGIGG